MAVSVPESYLTDARTGALSGEGEERWRLPPDHVQNIRDVAQGVEETNAGVCCRYLLDGLSGSSDVDDDGYVHHLEAVERFIERDGDFGPYVHAWREAIRRCRRAFALMRREGEHTHASVLHVVYGYPDPSAADLVASLGQDLARLARYTDAVEARRQELVKHEAHARAADGDSTDLASYRWWLRWADRVVSSADALRAALAPFGEPMPVRKIDENQAAYQVRVDGRKAREQAHKARREAFLDAVKLDARRMLRAAERAYWRAWTRSAAPS